MLTHKDRLFLSKQRIAHVGTLDSQDDPIVTPVCFALCREDDCGNQEIVFVAHKGSNLGRRLLRTLKSRQWIDVCVDAYKESWRPLQGIHVRGPVNLLEGEDRADDIQELYAKYPQWKRMYPIHRGYLLFWLEAKRIKRWKY